MIKIIKCEICGIKFECFGREGNRRKYCKKCAYEHNKEKVKKWYREHREEYLERQREYRNRPEVKKKRKEYDKKYAEKNAERLRERRKQYYQENKEMLRKAQKKWIKNNKDKINEYARNFQRKKRQEELKRLSKFTEEEKFEAGEKFALALLNGKEDKKKLEQIRKKREAQAKWRKKHKK